MRTVSSTFTSFKGAHSRYRVYLSEMRKRSLYVVLSLLFAWACAYTQRVALMYSLTLSLQQPFPKKSQASQVNSVFKSYNYNDATVKSFFSRILSTPQWGLEKFGFFTNEKGDAHLLCKKRSFLQTSPTCSSPKNIGSFYKKLRFLQPSSSTSFQSGNAYVCKGVGASTTSLAESIEGGYKPVTSQELFHETFDSLPKHSFGNQSELLVAKTSLYPNEVWVRQSTQPVCFSTTHGLHSLPEQSSDLAVHGGVRLIFTDVGEAFYTLLFISFFWCLWACFPVLVYHILCFFQPGFYIRQSQRVCASICRRLALGYLILWLVDLCLIPRLLSFFYSFSIERASLSLHAETKVVSYVSLYVFVYGTTVTILLFTVLWGSYKRRQILDWLREFNLSINSCTISSPFNHVSRDFQSKSSFTNKQLLSNQYRSQRGKVWWGCLLVAAFLSPPDISSQLTCALLLVLWSEVGIWLAYSSSCRLWGQLHNSFLSYQK